MSELRYINGLVKLAYQLKERMFMPDDCSVVFSHEGGNTELVLWSPYEPSMVVRKIAGVSHEVLCTYYESMLMMRNAGRGE